MQHDLYSWEVLGKEFVTLEEVTNGSEFVDKTIKEWLEKVEPAKREQVIDVVFADFVRSSEASLDRGRVKPQNMISQLIEFCAKHCKKRACVGAVRVA